jgi:hypothetical protein
MAAIRLVMTWDIQADQQQSYIEFMLSEFAPGIQRLGAQIIDAWYTQAGAGPQICLVLGLDRRESVDALLESAEFRRLYRKLLEYVEDFRWHIASSGAAGLEG